MITLTDTIITAICCMAGGYLLGIFRSISKGGAL